MGTFVFQKVGFAKFIIAHASLYCTQF
uniref:Uncharacterized protein n=1 Tax=Rhizophora mucronata TaxID=61149 RepID=A0A2P2PCA4_RHIMU